MMKSEFNLTLDKCGRMIEVLLSVVNLGIVFILLQLTMK
ncbi:endonuclease II [Klebsiella phage CPRSB]|nr:endonuclease II [Klebsiella phage CPRSB]